MRGKKLWNAVMAGMLCVSMLAGCGAKTENAPSEPAASEAAQTGEQESTEKAVEESAEAAGETPSWKKDTSPITIDWFVAYDWYGKVFDPVNNMADKKLQTETGITINVITGNADKLNALIVSGELPDVVTFDAVASQRLQMEDSGMVLDLEELSEKYAPDLLSLIHI